MIRAFFRRLKRFLLRHSGMTAVTEAQAATHLRLASLASSVDEVKAELAGIRVAVGAVADPLQGLAAGVADTVATLRQLKASLEWVMATLAAESAGRHQAEERWQGLAGQVQTMLGEQTSYLHRLADQTGDAAAFHHRLLEEQGLNRLAIDDRLAGMYSQLVHIESFYRLLSHLGSAFNRLAESNGPLEVDRWKIQEYEGLLRYSRKQEYLRAVDANTLPVPRLQTEHRIAAESNDTRFVRGAKNDNSICLRFNRKLYALLGNRPHLRVLDLGCAGGGFVRSLLDDGHFAVGLEGSPYPKINQVGEWGTIPYHLHTCDVTRPFTLTDSGTGAPLQFDAITAWELMEHIPEAAVPGLLANINKHLVPGGYLLCSIATFVDKDDEIGVVWHVTVKPREWWVERFAAAGFVVEEQQILDKDDWLRGSGNCRGDWHEDDNMGFHLALRRREAVASAAA